VLRLPGLKSKSRPPAAEPPGTAASLQAFLSGKMAYDDLVRGLKERAGQSGDAARETHATIEEAVELGRLPPDLGQIIKAQLPQGTAASSRDSGGPGQGGAGDMPSATDVADAAEADDFDEPTVPHAAPMGQRAGAAAGGQGKSYLPPLPYLTHPPAQAGDDMRAKVDDVVLGSLVGDFKGFRKSRETGGETAPAASKTEKVDHFLADFKNARFRSDARRAASGQSRGAASVDDFDKNGQARAGVGSILRDRFVLDEEIGRGGMGVVFAAVDRRRLEAGHDQPYVAVKVLNDAFRTNAAALRVMEAEARKAQTLAHPNITTVYDFDRDGGDAFIVMELLQGKTLDRRLSETLGQAVPMDEAAGILRGVCAGLAFAHSRGIIHSDLKPGNIFLTLDGTVKLLDFGLAAAAKADDADASLAGALTATYASPEMFTNAPRDPRDDIFGLGCIAYRVLSGRHPFNLRPSNEAMADKDQLAPLERADGALWRAVQNALAFDRSARLDSVALFEAAIPKIA